MIYICVHFYLSRIPSAKYEVLILEIWVGYGDLTGENSDLNVRIQILARFLTDQIMYSILGTYKL